MENETKGMLLALAAAVVSGIAIPANKWFIVSLDPLLFTAIRAILIGTAFLAISFILWNKKQREKSFAVNWKYLLAIAFIGGAIAFWLFFTGLKLTTAGRAAFLQKTLPLFVAILSFYFLREKISTKHWTAMALMFVGMIAVYLTTIQPSDFWSNPKLGDLMVVGAAILWGVETIVSKKAMLNGETNWMVSFARMFFGGIILFGFLLLFGNVKAIFSLNAQQWFDLLASTGLLFLYVLFFYWSLRFINASKAAMYLLVAPVVSLAIGAAFFGEPAPLTQLLGSAAILLGAFQISRIKSETLAPKVSLNASKAVN